MIQHQINDIRIILLQRSRDIQVGCMKRDEIGTTFQDLVQMNRRFPSLIDSDVSEMTANGIPQCSKK